MVDAFYENGWVKFPYDPDLAGWVQAVRPAALTSVRDPELRRQWLVCQGTWFVGVDALNNDTAGAIAGSGPLTGDAMAFANDLFGALPLHKAQVSIAYPGYPRPRDGESEAGYRYRLRRDSAHVDGVRAIGPDRRRYLNEHHAWILGLPLTEADPGASPLVVWEGSHKIIQTALMAVCEGHDPADWSKIDVTDAYQTARREIFETCRRVVLAGRPGEAVLLHRLVLHGVAPWGETATADPEGRAVAYFRPELTGGAAEWLKSP